VLILVLMKFVLSFLFCTHFTDNSIMYENLAGVVVFLVLFAIELSVKGPVVLPSSQTWKDTETRNLSVPAKATGVQNCGSP
jgi:hypothetical protein